MSSVKKTVLKVNINCERCKKDLLKAVTKLSGINQVTAEAAKGTLTVIGDVDPVLIVQQLRKAGRFAEVMTVGPPKPPEPKIYFEPIMLPPCCNDCGLVPVGYVSYGHHGGSPCNIL